jgi:hypothetical protein
VSLSRRADYGIALFVIGLLLTLLGQVAAHQLMSHLKRRSIVVFSMAILLTVVGSPYEPAFSETEPLRVCDADLQKRDAQRCLGCDVEFAPDHIHWSSHC